LPLALLAKLISKFPTRVYLYSALFSCKLRALIQN